LLFLLAEIYQNKGTASLGKLPLPIPHPALFLAMVALLSKSKNVPEFTETILVRQGLTGP
jgi:hypothetical protein